MINDWARRTSLSQAAAISCWFSLACCFASSLGAGVFLVGRGVA
jgi:hypothetical protein